MLRLYDYNMNRNYKMIKAEDLFGNPRDADFVIEREDGFEISWSWPKEIGSGSMARVKLRSGLALGLADFRMSQKISIGFEQMSMPVSFNFCACRRDPYFVYCTQAENELRVAGANCGSVVYRPEWNGKFCYPHEVPVHQLTICIAPHILGSFLDGLQGSIPISLNAIASGNLNISFEQTFQTTPVVNTAVHQIFDCPYRGTLKRFYYESKALELITYAISQIIAAKKPGTCHGKLLSRDVERVHEVREILFSNLENPPSLIELARQVGTNKNKLNRDFQLVFGASVFEYLRASRLEKAKTLIETGKLSVTEAALEVGYAHARNFTRAFRNYFGSHAKDHSDSCVGPTHKH